MRGKIRHGNTTDEDIVDNNRLPAGGELNITVDMSQYTNNVNSISRRKLEQ